MKQAEQKFTGFDKGLFKFLKDLKKNNKTEWFHSNKERYQQFLVAPAKAFIVEMAPFLNRLNPAIRTEPQFNKTIMRLNKDMRFAKGEPYRAFLLVHFGRFKLDSEFYIYFEPDSYETGMFINNSEGENLYWGKNLTKYKKEIIGVCKKYKINVNYSLSDLDDDMSVVAKKIDAEKHSDKLANIRYILLQQNKKPAEKTLYSDSIIDHMIRMISQLYPLYCFAVSPQPLKELQRFEDEFGEIV